MARIEGKEIAKALREDIKNRVLEFKKQHGYAPGLAVILVGDDPASQVYVNGKEKACIEVGMKSEVIRLPKETTQEELIAVIEQINQRSDMHGLLVQLPLPKHLDERTTIAAVAPEKDVDGLTLQNAGALFLNEKGLVPCTPKGCMHLLATTGVSLEGKHAVVIGRSSLVGKPISMLLQSKNATVTMCHSRTQNLKEICKTADILVAAIGKPEFVTKDYIKPGAIVIDVGINRTDSGLKGDVCYAEAEELASFITPVPGGVGPMTIAMLLENTYEAACNAL